MPNREIDRTAKQLSRIREVLTDVSGRLSALPIVSADAPFPQQFAAEMVRLCYEEAIGILKRAEGLLETAHDLAVKNGDTLPDSVAAMIAARAGMANTLLTAAGVPLMKVEEHR